jgi:hypothetical protein
MKRLLLWFALVVVAASPVVAQSQSAFVDAFSGRWQTYEQRFAKGASLCTVELSGLAPGSARMGLRPSGCAAPLEAATGWSIEGSQLVLYDAHDKEIARLGGNQKRITGATPAGMPVVLERPGGDGTATTLQGAYNASGCYLLGYSKDCAPRGELGEPQPGPDGRLQIQMQANLNAYPEPRADPANAIGQVQQGTCIVVDACIIASDGPWCRAQFGGETGWLRKLTLRQNRWPVVTFTNSCK